MSSTHAYVISSATGFNNVATVVGTVDNIPSTGPVAVTVQVSLGDVLVINANGGISALKAFIAPVMLSAAVKAGLSIPAAVAVTQLPTGTFSLGGYTYIVSSVTAVGDVATVVGSVNGTAVSIPASVSGLSALLAAKGVPGLESFVAPQMLAAAVTVGFVPANVTQLPTGAFTL